MPIKALTDRKTLSADFNEAIDAFIDAVSARSMPANFPSISPGPPSPIRWR